MISSCSPRRHAAGRRLLPELRDLLLVVHHVREGPREEQREEPRN